MRLITAALLSFMLMALCHGRSMRDPRQATLADLFSDEDDLSHDPDWVPTEEDYFELNSYEEDDNDVDEDNGFDRGTRQAKTAVGSTALGDPEDDVVNDPDWVPTADDYDDDDDEYDSDEYYDNGDYDDSDSEEGDNPVDALSSNDDDPDWKPYNDGGRRLDELLLNIALLTKENEGSDIGPDEVLSVFQTLKELDLTHEEAAQFLYTLQTEADTSENKIGAEAASKSPVAALVKFKRQVKSHRFSQATQDTNQDRFQGQPIQAIGEIQDSQPNQYDAGNNGYGSYGGGDYDQGQQGSGQSSQTGSINQASRGNQQDIAIGVEPYYPQAVNPNEVASGVEPLDRESASTGSSVINWLQRGWGHVVDTADRVGDKVEDTFSDWGDKIAGAASTAADSARDVAQSAGESIVNTYHRVKGKIPELLERIRSLFTKFGVLVQTGAEYYIQQMEETVDKVRQAEILDKLQQKLAEGNEQVTAFFQTLGEKASRWTQTHGHENVDAGLITIQQVHPEEGVVGEDIVQVGGQQTMPNWFQDEEVIEQLNQIMNSGIIDQSDMDFLSQQTRQEASAAATQTGTRQDQSQPQQNQQSPPPSSIIQSQNSGSRRALRALIDALMVH